MGNGLSLVVTESERRRVAAAAEMGVHIDPRSGLDAAVVIVFSVGYALTMVAAIYALYNRNYPPIRCKTPALMLGLVVFGAVWLVGDSQQNGQLPLKGTALENCKAFGMWMRILFGVITVSVLWMARVYGLYRVFSLGRSLHGWGMRILFGGYLVCVFVFGIVVQVVSADKTLHYVEPLDICVPNPKLLAAMFVIVWVNFTAVFVISWMLRNIKTSFNERRETVIACCVVLSILITTTSLHYGRPKYPFSLGLRTVVTSIDHAGTIFYWWLLMGVPLFNCAFRRQRYLDWWVAKLIEDGLELQYDIGYDEQNNVTTMYQPT
ncbi:hypothetical protein H4R18_000003, partial [Coemansia javaensis]